MRIIQSSVLYNFYREIKEKSPNFLEAEIQVAAYDLYIDHCKTSIGADPLLSFVRAWHLIQQLRIKNLTTAKCKDCEGEYVVLTGKLYHKYVCPLCSRSASLRPDVYRRVEELAA